MPGKYRAEISVLACALIPALVALLLIINGITTGLPSEERLIHELGGVDAVKAKEQDIRLFISTGKHVRSEFIAKSGKIDMAELSPYFDVLRTYHPDEQYILKILADMAKNRKIEPASFIYAPFFFYQVGAGLFVAKVLNLIPSNSDVVFFIKNPGLFMPVYLYARIFVALMTVGAVICVFMIGYETGGLKNAFTASMLFSVLPLVLLSGKFIKPDAPCLFWSSMTLLFSILLYKYGRLKYYILAGVFSAFAAGSKYPGILSCFYVASYFCARNFSFEGNISKNIRAVLKRKEFKYLIASGLACAGAFVATNPSCALRPAAFTHDVFWIAGVLRDGNFFANIFDFIVCFLYDGFFFTTGPFMTLFFVLAIFMAILKPDRLYTPALPVVFLFIIMASRGRSGSDAYLLPALAPAVMVSAGLLGKIKNRKILWILMAALIIPSLSLSLEYNKLAAAENVRLKASKWINRHIPADKSIARKQYPVSYRTAMAPPAVYKQYSMDIEPEKASGADYFIDCGYEWGGASWINRFTGDNRFSVPPSDKFRIIKSFEPDPLLFGFIPVTRDYMLTPYIETIAPKIIIYERKR